MTDENKPASKKSPQVSKAPPPITPVRGSGYIPKPSTNDRLPRWSYWRLMPEVKEWEAVALSLNIEPDKIKTDHRAYTRAAHPYDEGDDFNDRLMVLKKQSSNRAHFPTPCILNMVNWYQCEVRLDEFAAWCIHVGFEIPPELAALAKAATQAAPIPIPIEQSAQGKPTPEKISVMQENEILRIIRDELKLNPRKLIKPKAGTAGIKADVRKLLSIPNPTFQSNKVFDKAWQRLRDISQICDE